MPGSDEPTARAQAIIERVLGLVRECRLVLRALERPGEHGESSSAEAERVLYFTLMSAVDAGLIRTMEGVLTVVRLGQPAAWADGCGVAGPSGSDAPWRVIRCCTNWWSMRLKRQHRRSASIRSFEMRRRPPTLP
jgi:hypothetical protein